MKLSDQILKSKTINYEKETPIINDALGFTNCYDVRIHFMPKS